MNASDTFSDEAVDARIRAQREQRQRKAEPKAAPSASDALAQFIVRQEAVDAMEAARLIWRNLICETHLAVWAAPANAGKTTVSKLAAAELAAAGHTVMYFQEDAGAGDLPELFEHASTHGYRLLNSTLSGKAPQDMLNALHGLVAGGGDLRGHVFFVDTLKKFADLMNKGGSREFFRLMRGLTVRGCTAVLNGHTNKHRGPDGKLIFEGVGDVRNDVDELIYIEATDKDAQGTVTINMVPDKVRCMARELSLRYHTESRELQVLPGVVNVAAIAARQRQLKADASVISNVLVVLRRHGGMNFTELAEQVAIASGIGRNAARVVIERYASEDVGNTEALWMDTRIRTAKNARRISLRPIDGTVQ